MFALLTIGILIAAVALRTAYEAGSHAGSESVKARFATWLTAAGSSTFLGFGVAGLFLNQGFAEQPGSFMDAYAYLMFGLAIVAFGLFAISLRRLTVGASFWLVFLACAGVMGTAAYFRMR